LSLVIFLKFCSPVCFKSTSTACSLEWLWFSAIIAGRYEADAQGVDLSEHCAELSYYLSHREGSQGSKETAQG
jgi:hypothetical protein